MINLEKLLAKEIDNSKNENSVRLVHHQKNVSAVSEYLGNILIPNIDLIGIIKKVGLIHDIAKAIKRFQKMLETTSNKTGIKFLHNEIGWAFIKTYLKVSDGELELISNSIYWHHGIINKMSDSYSDTILAELTEEDIQTMKDLVKYLLGDGYLHEEKKNLGSVTPLFYKQETQNDYYNKKFSIIRSCVISADRIVSEFENNNPTLLFDINSIPSEIIETINMVMLKTENFTIDNSLIVDTYIEECRFNIQMGIANDCDFDNTNIIQAPAGFGKTMVGLIWASKNSKKTIWVCPRNMIAESVYDSILKEINTLKLTGVTVELYLTGEVSKSNHNNTNGFESDIIVTNIDNFLKPSITDRIANRQFLTYSANVVFDEYHEFVTDEPLFACFINLMKSRHQNTKCRTILLSATPVKINPLWETDKITIILPQENKHYPAAHTKNFLVETYDEYPYFGSGSDSSVIITNSINEAQYYYNQIGNNNQQLVHSKYEEDVKNGIFDKILKEYGKNSPRLINKDNIVGTFIIQASLDISFAYVYESVLSPEFSTQRLGRLNRFGDYNSILPVFTIFKLKDRNNSKRISMGENSVINEHYTKDLCDLWFDEMNKINGQSITLNDFYIIYNNHVENYKVERNKFFREKYNNSLKSLSKSIYPVRQNNTNSVKPNKYKINNNKIRSAGNNKIYCITKRTYNKGYTKPIEVEVYNNDFSITFGENSKTLGNMLKEMKKVMRVGIEDVDYKKILRKKDRITLEEIQKLARNSDTPYIRFDNVHDDVYGEIKKKTFESFK